MEREIITIRGEKKIVKTDGVYLLGDRAGQKWDKEQWNYWLKSMEADLCNAETSEEYIAGLKHIYSEHQRGLANESNFFWNTVAVFEQVNSRPRRKIRRNIHRNGRPQRQHRLEGTRRRSYIRSGK